MNHGLFVNVNKLVMHGSCRLAQTLGVEMRYERKVYLFGLIYLPLERIIETSDSYPIYPRDKLLIDVAWYLRPFCIIRFDPIKTPNNQIKRT